MLTISSAVEQIVFSSDFAIEGLQNGCLNLSAYTDTIRTQVELLTKKSVQRGSIIVALGRISSRYRAEDPDQINFQVYSIATRSGLTELTYAKTAELQRDIARVFQLPDVHAAPFFAMRIGLVGVAIVTRDKLAHLIRAILSDHKPILYMSELSSLTLQVDFDAVDMPRQSYTIIKQLALRNINCVEYITGASEHTFILHNDDLKDSFAILHDKFSTAS